MSKESFFRCPTCKKGRIANLDTGSVGCDHCKIQYPILDGIPFLVKDMAGHEETIREAQKRNPEWYLAEQPPEVTSPWRHHLRKRRQYIESVLMRELSLRNVTLAPRLLDLGCGDGNNLIWLAPFAHQLYGSDYNIDRLTRAHSRCSNANLFLADLLDYPAFDNSFDVIFFNHVIEHIHDDQTALETVKRILKPSGLLILGVPNEGAWWWQLAYKRAPDILATTDHVHFYTAATISEKMRSAGLKINEVKHLGWGPPDFHLDGKWRKYKLADDIFESIGRFVIPSQASSLYLIATK